MKLQIERGEEMELTTTKPQDYLCSLNLFILSLIFECLNVSNDKPMFCMLMKINKKLYYATRSKHIIQSLNHHLYSSNLLDYYANLKHVRQILFEFSSSTPQQNEHIMFNTRNFPTQFPQLRTLTIETQTHNQRYEWLYDLVNNKLSQLTFEKLILNVALTSPVQTYIDIVTRLQKCKKLFRLNVSGTYYERLVSCLRLEYLQHLELNIPHTFETPRKSPWLPNLIGLSLQFADNIFGKIDLFTCFSPLFTQLQHFHCNYLYLPDISLFSFPNLTCFEFSLDLFGDRTSGIELVKLFKTKNIFPTLKHIICEHAFHCDGECKMCYLCENLIPFQNLLLSGEKDHVTAKNKYTRLSGLPSYHYFTDASIFETNRCRHFDGL